MNIPRVFITPDRVSVSRPNIDVLTAPRHPDYMAIDSLFPPSVRLLQSSILYGLASASFNVVFYGTTYPVPPIVEVCAYNAATYRLERVLVMGRGSGQPKNFTAPLNIQMFTNRFQFATTDPSAEGGYANQPRDWIYFVYPP